jgi:hypothetical protein
MTAPGDADRPVFDPRHDARFQRGYRPGQDAAAPRPPRNAPFRSAPAVAPPAVDPPPAGSAPRPDGTVRVGEPGTGDSAGDVPDLDTLGFDAENFQDEPAPTRWNPFIVLLWVIGVTFPVGGIALQWQAVQGMYGGVSFSGNGEPEIGFLLQQFSYMVAPSLIVAGFVVIAGLLFWHAWAWQARRRRAASESPAG